MTLADVLPSIRQLSALEKLQLMRILEEELGGSDVEVPESSIPRTWAELSLQAQTVENGYTSREKVLELIQTVKQELAIERDQRLVIPVTQASR
jgi:hypothetical protein